MCLCHSPQLDDQDHPRLHLLIAQNVGSLCPGWGPFCQNSASAGHRFRQCFRWRARCEGRLGVGWHRHVSWIADRDTCHGGHDAHISWFPYKDQSTEHHKSAQSRMNKFATAVRLSMLGVHSHHGTQDGKSSATQIHFASMVVVDEYR